MGSNLKIGKNMGDIDGKFDIFFEPLTAKSGNVRVFDGDNLLGEKILDLMYEPRYGYDAYDVNAMFDTACVFVDKHIASMTN